jgi:hypothetical protein
MSFGGVMAQRTADIGVQVAAATYWGDLEGVNYSKSVTPVVGVLGRWNFNKRLAIRGQLFTGNLKAEGTFTNANIGQPGTGLGSGIGGGNPNLDPFPVDPDYAFNFSRSIQSVEGLFEFNFRNYKLGNMKKETFTPFVAVGIGGLYSRAPRKGSFILYNWSANLIPVLTDPITDLSGTRTNGYDVFTLTIPVGAGFKFNFSKRLGGMLELIVRKTFSDNIDNLDDPARYQSVPFTVNTADGSYDPKVTGQFNNNDWYATLAFSLIWQLWSDKGNCAIYDKLKR